MGQIIVKSKAANNLKALITSAVENEMRTISFGITKTRRKLAEMEKETGMSSKDFYRQFQEGKLGDDIKLIKWAGEYETLERLEDDYRHLQELELCS